VRLREILAPDRVKVPKTPTELKELESIHKVTSFFSSMSSDQRKCMYFIQKLVIKQNLRSSYCNRWV